MQPGKTDAYELERGKQNQWHANQVNYHVHLVMMISTILYCRLAAGHVVRGVARWTRPCRVRRFADRLTKVSCLSRSRDMANYRDLETKRVTILEKREDVRSLR